MLNAVSIDVEDYFHVSAFERYIKREDWDNYSLRVEDNTVKILDLLDEFSVKATFFILGWVAERRPLLVKEIHRRGHEIACHGYGHQLIYHIGYENFRQDVRKAKSLIEDICGEAVTGFRAPSYSITKKSLWALDILIEEGFAYDSSIFPVLHDIYGIADACRFPSQIRRPSGVIKEFPLSTLQINLMHIQYNLPIAGGGYLRLLPVWLIKKAINRINTIESQPAIIYFHPWEIDHKQPRIRASMKSRARHYLNLDKTLDKITYLLRHIDFCPIRTVLEVQKSGVTVL